jgi:hypothetical protein
LQPIKSSESDHNSCAGADVVVVVVNAVIKGGNGVIHLHHSDRKASVDALIETARNLSGATAGDLVRGL